MSDTGMTAPQITVVPAAPGREGPAARLRALRGRLMSGSVGATVARGAAWSFGINVASMGIGFIVQLQLARALRPAEYGVYLVVLASINLAMLAGKLEFDPCAVRYIGAYTGTLRWSHLRGFVRRSHQIVTLASLGVAGIVAVGVLALRDVIPRNQVPSYLVGCAILPVTALLLLQFGCLQGLRE
jgi:O-antigen/teichoic acid export membrane protein